MLYDNALGSLLLVNFFKSRTNLIWSPLPFFIRLAQISAQGIKIEIKQKSMERLQKILEEAVFISLPASRRSDTLKRVNLNKL